MAAHDRLLQLQKEALSYPFSTTFDDVAAREAIFSELSSVEEAFFKQKSRIKWLNEGDHNSTYFHGVLKGRQVKMKIAILQDDEGHTLTDMNDIIS